uniref:Uncharacterized protein n=1 Tax=Anopheles atroparvus TaxID=41427 RepID=A0A182J3L6_ANOAO
MAEDCDKAPAATGDVEKTASKQASPAPQQKNSGSKGASPNKAAGKAEMAEEYNYHRIVKDHNGQSALLRATDTEVSVLRSYTSRVMLCHDQRYAHADHQQGGKKISTLPLEESRNLQPKVAGKPPGTSAARAGEPTDDQPFVSKDKIDTNLFLYSHIRCPLRDPMSLPNVPKAKKSTRDALPVGVTRDDIQERPHVTTLISSLANYSNTIPAPTDPDAKPAPAAARMVPIILTFDIWGTTRDFLSVRSVNAFLGYASYQRYGEY